MTLSVFHVPAFLISSNSFSSRSLTAALALPCLIKDVTPKLRGSNVANVPAKCNNVSFHFHERDKVFQYVLIISW